MKNDICFSVIICCYNSEKYLSETIDSIIKQTYTNWEIIAVNDGSSDNTEKILQEYKQKGIPIIYHYQENKGFANARNKAIELANFDWIAIIDHDDISLPERLEKQAKDIMKNQNCSLFFGNSIHFLDDGLIIRTQFDNVSPHTFDLSAGNATNRLINHGCFIDSETVVFNKHAAESIGKFNEKYKYITDYDFFLNISEKYNLFCNPDILSKWRIHENQATNTMKSDYYKEHITISKYYLLKNDISFYSKLKLIIRSMKIYLKIILSI